MLQASDNAASQNTGPRYVNTVTYLVQDYNEAIEWFTTKLDFTVSQDIPTGENTRWIIVTPPSKTPGTSFLLAKAEGFGQLARVGTQTGDHVAFFLSTTDFQADHKLFLERGIHFLEEPRYEVYGTVAVFEDIYGNTWDLIEHSGGDM